MCDALRRERVSLPQMHEYLSQAHNLRVRGSRVLTYVIESVDPGGLRSAFEVLMSRLLRNAGLQPVAGYRLVRNGVLIAELDFAFPALKLGIECDGHGSHVQKRDFDRNIGRYNGFGLTDWTVLRFSWRHLKKEPDVTIRTIREAIASKQNCLHLAG